MSQQVQATIVNHAAITIAAPADAVWGVIVEEILQAKGFRAAGTVVPLEDPGFPLGGYRISLPTENGDADERLVRFTERDDTARRASVRADYLSAPGGSVVYASYEAEETAHGARFRLDCHTSTSLDIADDGDIAAAIARETAFNDDALAANLLKVKQRLEAAG